MEQRQSAFDIKKVATIARLKLTENEMKKIEKDVREILKAFGDLDKIEASCEPSFQPIKIANVTRKDEPEKTLTQEQTLSGSEHKENGFFKGPRII